MGGAAGFEILDERDGGRRTLRLRGELDIAGVPSLEAAITRVCDDGAESLTIDLATLDFIDSTGLAALVHAATLCAEDDRRFQIVPGPRPVQRLFELTGLDGVLPFAGASAERAG